jgi:hypothetical protein
LNQHLLAAVENSGEAFLSNAVIGGKFVLRACIVNFRTSSGDIEALSLLLSRLGEEADDAFAAVLTRVLRAGSDDFRDRDGDNALRVKSTPVVYLEFSCGEVAEWPKAAVC